jgi:hypothetical protein
MMILSTYNLRAENKSLYNQTMRYMKVYFDLCDEECYLNKNGLIEKRGWEKWSERINNQVITEKYEKINKLKIN